MSVCHSVHCGSHPLLLLVLRVTTGSLDMSRRGTTDRYTTTSHVSLPLFLSSSSLSFYPNTPTDVWVTTISWKAREFPLPNIDSTSFIVFIYFPCFSRSALPSVELRRRLKFKLSKYLCEGRGLNKNEKKFFLEFRLAHRKTNKEIWLTSWFIHSFSNHPHMIMLLQLQLYLRWTKFSSSSEDFADFHTAGKHTTSCHTPTLLVSLLCLSSGSAWRVGQILSLLQVPAHWSGQVIWRSSDTWRHCCYEDDCHLIQHYVNMKLNLECSDQTVKVCINTIKSVLLLGNQSVSVRWDKCVEDSKCNEWEKLVMRVIDSFIVIFMRHIKIKLRFTLSYSVLD